MHNGNHDFASGDHTSSRYERLNHGMENLLSYMADECPEQLKKAAEKDASFQTTLEKLKKHTDRFDESHSIPYGAAQMDSDELRETYDKAAASLARMCGLLYKKIQSDCSFGDHHVMLNGMMDAMNDFNRHANGTLKSLGLEYHEFDSLALELEAKLGLTAPLETDRQAPELSHVEKSDRRRRLPKDPVKIEAALHKCLDSAARIRPMINNEKKQTKLDGIVDDVRSILSNLPEGDDDVSKGRRISALVSASAKILKVGKWIRKVELLESEQSQSAKREILTNFQELTALSRGQQNGRHH